MDSSKKDILVLKTGEIKERERKILNRLGAVQRKTPLSQTPSNEKEIRCKICFL
jgi:hypothetical protein